MPPTKPVLHPLKTPKSATFPSELNCEPLSSRSSGFKRREDLSTPISPPAAYTLFLEALTPAFTSPLSAGTSFPQAKFLDQFERRPLSQPTSAIGGTFRFENSFESASNPASASTSGPASSSTSTSISVPASTSTSISATTSISASRPSSTQTSTSNPNDREATRSPRHGRIPPSIKASLPSDSPKSATNIRSPFSPSDWKMHCFDGPRSANSKPVNVRQVVTRTVTYKRTQLDAPPARKRRKRSNSRTDCDQ